MKKYLKLMRAKHYIKNILILLPVILTQQLFAWKALYKASIGIIIFSLMSSVIYIVNDIKDINADRLHPAKCRRPLASGEISVHKAEAFAVILIIIIVSVWGGAQPKFAPEYMVLPFVYLCINIAYSIKLKEYPLIDVLILMLGYLMRLEYGALLIGTGVSAWMFLTVTASAFFLGFGKRRNELLMYGDNSRKNLKIYTVDFLDQACQMSMTTAIVFYALSCADTNTVIANAGVDLLWSVPLAFIICLKYLMNLHRNDCDGDPVEVILKDKLLLTLCAAFFIVLMVLLYCEIGY